MQHIPGVPIIDISHEVQPYNAAQAAYLLASAYRNFPTGTCHVVLLDFFSVSPCKLILYQYKDFYFLCTGNSVIPLALETDSFDAWLCYELNPAETFRDWLFAATRILQKLQTRKPNELKLKPYHSKKVSENYLPLPETNYLKCEVIHIDSYENVVLNITTQQLQSYNKGKVFRLQFTGMEEINGISADYNDVRAGYKLCRFNGNGYLEICINRGKAASLFGLKPGGKFNDVKIFFE